jgi:hypothetical protein
VGVVAWEEDGRDDGSGGVVVVHVLFPDWCLLPSTKVGLWYLFHSRMR